MWTHSPWFAILTGLVLVTFPFVFVAGAALYFWGFLTFRKYRVLADTPELPIGSVSMGLVEIHGKASGENLITSPVTRVPCHFYKARIDSYSGPKNPPDVNGMSDWKPVFTDMQGESFYLQDETGKIKVFPRMAELEVPFTMRLVKVHQDEERKKQEPAADSELADYVHNTLTNRDRAALSQVADPQARAIAQLFQRAHYGTYRVGEFCIFPDTSYDVTGTCVENPHPQDLNDRNLIVKGRDEHTFVISSKAEKAMEEDLRLRARRYIFGGGSVMVASLALWLVAFGFSLAW